MRVSAPHSKERSAVKTATLGQMSSAVRDEIQRRIWGYQCSVVRPGRVSRAVGGKTVPDGSDARTRWSEGRRRQPTRPRRFMPPQSVWEGLGKSRGGPRTTRTCCITVSETCGGLRGAFLFCVRARTVRPPATSLLPSYHVLGERELRSRILACRQSEMSAGGLAAMRAVRRPSRYLATPER